MIEAELKLFSFSCFLISGSVNRKTLICCHNNFWQKSLISLKQVIYNISCLLLNAMDRDVLSVHYMIHTLSQHCALGKVIFPKSTVSDLY